jgi:hypothetical protein
MVNNTTDNFATSSNTVLRFEAIKQYVWNTALFKFFRRIYKQREVQCYEEENKNSGGMIFIMTYEVTGTFLRIKFKVLQV